MVKKVIYTCLVDNYDELRQPLVVDDSYDYICFSNDFEESKMGIWQIRPIPYESRNNVRLSRYVKLVPHKILKDYDYSLWIDANIQIVEKEFYDIVDDKIALGGLVYQVNHVIPPIDCIYDEIKFAYYSLRCGFFEAIKQYLHLKRNRFPNHWGLYENNVILRKHNSPLVKKISEEWWEEYLKYTKRDQFSLMYIYWKNSFRAELLLDPKSCTRNVPFLRCVSHNNRTSTGGEGKRYYRVKYREKVLKVLNFIEKGCSKIF